MSKKYEEDEEYPDDIDFEDEYIEDELLQSEGGKKSKKQEKLEPVMTIDAKEMLSEIKSYYASGVFSRNLADMIYRLAENMARRSNFVGYSWKDDMILDGYEKMAMAIYEKKYNVNSGFSPFSYLSRICWRSFILRIKKEKQIKENEASYREKMYDKIRAENTGIKFKEETYNGEKIYTVQDSRDLDDWD